MLAGVEAEQADDECGELGAFMEIWRGALRAAKSSGAPGVVLDLEAYNNYDANNTLYLARELGQV